MMIAVILSALQSECTWQFIIKINDSINDDICQSSGSIYLYEIVPAEPYTNDDLNWRDNNSRVFKEHDDESLRDVELVSTEVETGRMENASAPAHPIQMQQSGLTALLFPYRNDKINTNSIGYQVVRKYQKMEGCVPVWECM